MVAILLKNHLREKFGQLLKQPSENILNSLKDDTLIKISCAHSTFVGKKKIIKKESKMRRYLAKLSNRYYFVTFDLYR